eukprot:2720481-Prymnesium_polylepis.1
MQQERSIRPHTNSSHTLFRIFSALQPVSPTVGRGSHRVVHVRVLCAHVVVSPPGQRPASCQGERAAPARATRARVHVSCVCARGP